MAKRLVILHTTAVTIQPLKDLAAELLPECTVFNIVDDSILPDLIAHGGDVSICIERVLQYVEIAAQIGDLVLDACSSIGGLMEQAQTRVSVPVVRIDDAMAEHAVRSGRRIGVAATLSTTLQPTTSLLKHKALLAEKEIEVVPYLAEGAYQALLDGDAEQHDQTVARYLREAYQSCDLVVLAQASMARVVEHLTDVQHDRFLTSPRLGMEKVRGMLQ